MCRLINHPRIVSSFTKLLAIFYAKVSLENIKTLMYTYINPRKLIVYHYQPSSGKDPAECLVYELCMNTKII